MHPAPTAPRITLVDDGELDEVVRVLEASGLAFVRHRGGSVPARIERSGELLIVTSRRLEHLAPRAKASRRANDDGRASGSASAGASEEKPLCIVAVAEDGPALRRRLRRQGMHLLVRLPATRETWRLLVARALYQGEERRDDLRIATELPVALPHTSALLVDLSNRGCRIQSNAALAVGDAVRFSIPGTAFPRASGEPLELSGRVRRVAAIAGSDRHTCAVVFDANLDGATRRRLTALINHWASGAAAHAAIPAAGGEGPAIPACRLPALPDLVLDDETDPPVRANRDVSIALRGDPGQKAASGAPESTLERRREPRGAYLSLLKAQAETRALVVVGRDLSARGMRIERHVALTLGDRFRLSLNGPALARPIVVEATVVRDDAQDGMGLAFHGMTREIAAALEKLVACLPDVESLTDGELGGLGSVISEIVREPDAL
jgi:PilZ domain